MTEKFKEYVFNPENKRCQTCKDLVEAAPSADFYKMLFEPLAIREREQYLELSKFGKLKYKLRRAWRRLRHKPIAPLGSEHPNCRCYMKEESV
jgi:hypothetical protein